MALHVSLDAEACGYSGWELLMALGGDLQDRRSRKGPLITFRTHWIAAKPKNKNSMHLGAPAPESRIN